MNMLNSITSNPKISTLVLIRVQKKRLQDAAVRLQDSGMHACGVEFCE
jgi:hypothetical protein